MMLLRIFVTFACCAAIAVTSHRKSFADEGESTRYCVMRFVGTTEFPHSNQTAMDLTGRAKKFSSNEDVSKAPTLCIIVADSVERRLFCYARTKLWRMDTGELDIEKEYLWRDDGSGAQFASSDDWTFMPLGGLWTVDRVGIFAAPFEISTNADLSKVVQQITLTCMSPSLGESKDVIVGKEQLKRVVGDSGGSLIINHRYADNFITTTRITSDDDIDGYRCKFVAMLDDKPTEVRAGVLTLSQSDEMPEEIVNVLTQLASTEPMPVRASTLRESQTDKEQSRSHWFALSIDRNIVMLGLGLFAYLVVVLVRVLRISHVQKGAIA